MANYNWLLATVFVLITVITNRSEAVYRGALIMNSTECGPIYVQPQSGFAIYGRSDQDQVIKSMEPTCGNNVECVAFQCFGLFVLFGPSVVKCDPYSRQWSQFPYCGLPLDETCQGNFSVANEAKYQCWRKRQRWRYNASTGVCEQYETCARTRDQGGDVSNLFLTERECRQTCNPASIQNRIKTTPRPVLKTSRLDPLVAEVTDQPATNRYDGAGGGDNGTVAGSDYNNMMSRILNNASAAAGVIASLMGGNILNSTANMTEILNEHNKWRSAVVPNPVKPLDNLQWDNELTRIAELYAAQCPEREQHPGSRRLVKWSSGIGQNIAFSSWDDRTWTEIIDFWADERLNWAYGVGAIQPSLPVEHYTVMIAADSVNIGCAKSKCNSPPFRYRYIWVCNYAPTAAVDAITMPYQAAPQQ